MYWVLASLPLYANNVTCEVDSPRELVQQTVRVLQEDPKETASYAARLGHCHLMLDDASAALPLLLDALSSPLSSEQKTAVMADMLLVLSTVSSSEVLALLPDYADPERAAKQRSMCLFVMNEDYTNSAYFAHEYIQDTLAHPDVVRYRILMVYLLLKMKKPYFALMTLHNLYRRRSSITKI